MYCMSEKSCLFLPCESIIKTSWTYMCNGTLWVRMMKWIRFNVMFACSWSNT